MRVVPASRWAFARLDLRGEWGHLLDSLGNGNSLRRLKSEFVRQQAKSKRGPRIAATLGPLRPPRRERDLIAGWRTDPVTQTVGSSRPVPFLVVRTQPMSGPAGLFVGVRIDRFHPPHSLVGPAQRYRISPRELQVLALLLDGAKLEEIGLQLHITSSTVQDHIKSMLDKTGSRNRGELIARVLSWENTPDSVS